MFVSNLTSDVTEEVLKEKFSKYGELERVKKLSGYAFIHFEKREDAENALKNVLIDTVSKQIDMFFVKGCVAYRIRRMFCCAENIL